MMCYKDMTFCSAPCSNTECRRNYNDDVVAASHEWWGSDTAPIALSDFSNGCEEYTKTDEGEDNDNSSN